MRNYSNAKGSVYFFCIEFTNYNDVEIGKKAILLLENLAYQVLIPEHVHSGRSFLTTGRPLQAKKCAEQYL